MSKSAGVVLDCSSRLGLSDPWRFKNHQDKVFSYLSHVNHTFSRIDFFLLDNKIQIFIKSHIDLYFEINETPEIGLGILWEAFKSFIRGQIICDISYSRKLNASKLVILADELQKVTSPPLPPYT